MKSGHIYIASNPSIPGLLKIGETRSVWIRQHSLSTSNVPVDYRILYFRYCCDVREAERLVFLVSASTECRLVKNFSKFP